MLDKTPTAKLSQLLDALGGALASGDADAAAELFLDNGFWRDLVAFTWNMKTLEGRDQIRAMLEQQLPLIQPSGFAVAEGEEATEADGLLEGWIQFETKAGRGYGQIRVRDGKIWTLLTTLVELKGFEERAGFDRPLGALHGAGKNRRTWKEEREAEAAELGRSRQPYCLIVGGGQGGIALGARLRQLGVPTLIVEKKRTARRFLAQAVQVALPPRPSLVRPPPLYRLPQELAGVLAQGQDRRLAGDVCQGHGTQLLGLHRGQERHL